MKQLYYSVKDKELFNDIKTYEKITYDIYIKKNNDVKLLNKKHDLVAIIEKKLSHANIVGFFTEESLDDFMAIKSSLKKDTTYLGQVAIEQKNLEKAILEVSDHNHKTIQQYIHFLKQVEKQNGDLLVWIK